MTGGISRRRFFAALAGSAVFARWPATAFAQLITGASEVTQQPGRIASALEVSSPSSKLVDVFHWAKSQAMAYAFDSGDPVGPWYEAVEPGREGFCIRDTCHQALGAHALGLARFNRNMLRRFAENVSDSRDWCSYWEIDRFNEPAPVDYQDDAEFWYNLPANFDLVDCCFRMYVWSGDRTYIQDPVFLNLYERTVKDYVERWGLDIDHIMKRPRLLNARGIFDDTKKFSKARGIPGYDEQDHTYIVGFDVLVTQRAAYLAYAHLQEARFNAEAAAEFKQKAKQLEDLLLDQWWNKASQCFYTNVDGGYHLAGCGRTYSSSELGIDWYTDVTSGPASAGRRDDPDAAVARLTDLSHARLEYPEVSFTRVGDIVTEVLGITLEYSSPLLASVEGDWVEVAVRTRPGLGTGLEWAEVRNLPIRACTVTVRHDGMRQTTFTSQSGPALIWKPTFEGAHESLLVNGRQVKGLVEKDSVGREVTSLRVTVGAGGAVTVGLLT
jgi:hypothetical protein